MEPLSHRKSTDRSRTRSNMIARTQRCLKMRQQSFRHIKSRASLTSISIVLFSRYRHVVLPLLQGIQESWHMYAKYARISDTSEHRHYNLTITPICCYLVVGACYGGQCQGSRETSCSQTLISIFIAWMCSSFEDTINGRLGEDGCHGWGERGYAQTMGASWLCDT
jgi:hypothetical protein